MKKKVILTLITGLISLIPISSYADGMLRFMAGGSFLQFSDYEERNADSENGQTGGIMLDFYRKNSPHSLAVDFYLLREEAALNSAGTEFNLANEPFTLTENSKERLDVEAILLGYRFNPKWGLSLGVGLLSIRAKVRTTDVIGGGNKFPSIVEGTYHTEGTLGWTAGFQHTFPRSGFNIGFNILQSLPTDLLLSKADSNVVGNLDNSFSFGNEDDNSPYNDFTLFSSGITFGYSWGT